MHVCPEEEKIQTRYKQIPIKTKIINKYYPYNMLKITKHVCSLLTKMEEKKKENTNRSQYQSVFVH